MKKLILTSVIAATMGLSTAAIAHQDENNNQINISSDNCDLAFSNKLSITPDTVNIEASSGVVQIDQDGHLLINGLEQNLSANEQTLLAQYADDVRGQVPVVAEVAMEGIALAGTALNEVGNAFGIENMAAMEQLMAGIGEELQNAFYEGGTFVVDQGRFDAIGNTFDSQFDEQMEQAMEEMLMQSIGSILIALGGELLSSGGNMSEFEQRMENLGHQLEEKVQFQAKNIEQKAHQLCYDFKDLAQQEDELQARIPALKNYDVFNVESTQI